MIEHAVCYLVGAVSGAFLGVASYRTMYHRLFMQSNTLVRRALGPMHSMRPPVSFVWTETWLSVATLFAGDRMIQRMAEEIEQKMKEDLQKVENKLWSGDGNGAEK